MEWEALQMPTRWDPAWWWLIPLHANGAMELLCFGLFISSAVARTSCLRHTIKSYPRGRLDLLTYKAGWNQVGVCGVTRTELRAWLRDHPAIIAKGLVIVIVRSSVAVRAWLSGFGKKISNLGHIMTFSMPARKDWLVSNSLDLRSARFLFNRVRIFATGPEGPESDINGQKYNEKHACLIHLSSCIGFSPRMSCFALYSSY